MTADTRGRKSNESGGSSDLENDVLALHRLDTAPRTTSERFQQEDRRRKMESAYPITDEFDDVDDEEAFLRDADLEAVAAARAAAAADRAPVLDKTGRPEWLKEGIRAARLSRRVRLLLGLGVLLLLLAIFSFAFSSGTDDSRVNRVYKWAGDIWHPSNMGAGAPYAFPTDVGYPGPTQTGKPANLAEEDRYQAEPTRGNSPVQTDVPELHGFEPFKHMGNMSPYFSAPDFGISTEKYRVLPEQCRIDRVHILHRHGSRYPTTSSPANLLRKLLRDMKGTIKFTGPLAFLSHYDPNRLGLELLVPLGRQQLFESGVLHAYQYGALTDADLKEHGKLFIRAGSQQRIVDSAFAFLQGMFANKWHSQTELEVQIEAPGFNTTLAPNFACPRAGREETEPGIAWGKEWYVAYLGDAVKRLAPHAQGVQLDAQLLNSMQQLCSYDTVAFGRSDFCRLFTAQEWLDYEYYWDLVFYGSYGDGSEVGKAQGLGWVNEFMSRLTQTKWNESTMTSENSTFNNNPPTFPVDRRFYADFTHDSTIAGVLAALNLPDFNTPLPVMQPDPKRKYRTSTIVPYGARMVFEEISCEKGKSPAVQRRAPWGLGKGATSKPGSSYEDRLLAEGRSHYVRMLLNEAIVDLHQLKGCDARADGMCERSQFINAMEGRNRWGHWEKCFDAV